MTVKLRMLLLIGWLRDVHRCVFVTCGRLVLCAIAAAIMVHVVRGDAVPLWIQKSERENLQRG